MSRRFKPRAVALTVVCLLFGIGGAAVLTHPGEERISFDAVIEIWTSIVRDIDRFGLTITHISARREMEIGEEIDLEIAVEYSGPVPSDRAEYVRDVGQLLVPFTERHGISYSFQLIDSTEANAFSVPGGRIYITTAMLDFAKSESELAAVLGHEISHVDLRHCVELLQYELAARKIAGDDIAGIVRVGYRLVQLGFSEQQEIEADVNGILLAAKAGYDPREAIAIAERLGILQAAERQPEQKSGTMVGEIGGALLRALESYFKTHPPAVLRIPALKQAIERNAADWHKREFYVGRRNYEEWRARSKMDLPNEWVEFSR
jgi:beta-barrel assembly-enhancing protease